MCCADFETDWTADKSFTWVAQYAYKCDSGEENAVNTVLDHDLDFNGVMGFLWELIHISEKNKRPVVCYFHNLSNFDGGFLIQALYTYQKSLLKDYIIQFIERDGNIIHVSLCVDKGKKNLDVVVQFRDSFKIFNESVEALGGSKKHDWDWVSGWSSENKSLDYIKEDVDTVFRCLSFSYSQNHRGYSASGDAVKEWVNSGVVKKIRVGTNPKYAFKDFRSVFPELGYLAQKSLRPFYAGGLNISCNKGKHYNVRQLDVVSMYPYVMTKNLPYGPFTFWDHAAHGLPPNGCLWLGTFFITKMTLKDGCTPIYEVRSKIDREEQSLKFGEKLCCLKKPMLVYWSNVDYRNYLKSYDIVVGNIISVQRFCGSDSLFTDFLDKWFKLKQEGKKLKKLGDRKGFYKEKFAKLNLNGCYGRLGIKYETPARTVRFNDKKGCFVFANVYDEKTGSKIINCEEEMSNTYLPISIFITAYAREKLCDMIRLIDPADFLHADTDSVTYVDREKYQNIPIGDKLGDWEEDKKFKVYYEFGVKRYLGFVDGNEDNISAGNVKTKCAGMPKLYFNDKNEPMGMWCEVFDNPLRLMDDSYEFGHQQYVYQKQKRIINTLKLQKNQVKGGVILKGVTFSPRNLWWKY